MWSQFSRCTLAKDRGVGKGSESLLCVKKREGGRGKVTAFRKILMVEFQSVLQTVLLRFGDNIIV